MTPLTSIGNRLTPSVPLEITFGAMLTATGKKKTVMFAHFAAAGSTAAPYSIYDVVNVGDPDLAKAEVDAVAGAGSQAGKMAYAFVAANSKAGRSNYPAFSICFLKNADAGFGATDEAIAAVKLVRADMIVSCYPAGSNVLRGKVIDLATLISGVDRDLSGQFGSFATFGSLDALATAEAYNVNSNKAIVAYLQDTNTADLAAVDGDVTTGQSKITNITDTTGIYTGAQITGLGVPANTFAGVVDGHTVQMVDANGVDVSATGTHVAEAIDFQNVVSQSADIVAAAHAGGLMSFGFPYMPLTNVTIGGLIPPRKSSDRIVIDPNGASEAALTAGLSPLSVQPGGTVGFIRTRTTWVMNGLIPVTNYFDYQQLVVLNDFREDCFIISQNPPFNNNPGGTKASQQIASQLKDEILNEAQQYEDAQAFQNVKALAKQFIVQPSTTQVGRFDFKIPVDAIPGLYVIAGNIQAVTELTTFTL